MKLTPRTFTLALVFVLIFCDGILVPLLPKRKRPVTSASSSAQLIEIELPDIHFLPDTKE